MAQTLLVTALMLVVVCGNTAENGGSCPAGCVCATATLASCRNVRHDGMSSLLHQLPSTTWSLEVINVTADNASAPDIMADIVVARLPGLTELTLTNCLIRELRGGHFAGLERLSRLNLSSNLLTKLQEGVFKQLTSLQVLNLSWNSIADVSDGWLKGLENLQVLDLSSNDISVLEEAVFAYLPSLQRLNLSFNKLSFVAPTSLNLNSSLLWLDLSRNNISSLNDSIFNFFENLRVLNLAQNNLEALKGQYFSRLSNLQQLDISQNNISTLDDGVFSELNSLQKLNLSDNTLEALSDECFIGLTRLQQLDVSRNQICSVSPGTFQSMGSLMELILADNPVLGRLRQELMVLVGTGRRLQIVDVSRSGLCQVPAALTRSIRSLRLAGNQVTTVRCGDLDSYPLLQLLDLSDNQIVELEEDALGRLEVLSTLHLSGNDLQVVPRSLPSGLTALHLQRNKIHQLSTGDFQGLPRLKYLSLRSSNISVIQNGALSQLTALEILDISENPLKSLPGNALSGPLMTVLRLSSLNGIASTAGAKEMSFPVTSPERLEVLELDSSPVLAQQLLADTAALAAFRQLRELNLGNVGLTNLRSDFFHFLPRLRTLRLNGNPWDCEDMLWLANWIRRQQKHQQQQLESSLEDAYCASPPRLASTPVIHLQDSDFNITTSNADTSTFSSMIVTTSIDGLTAELRYDATVTAKMFPIARIRNTQVLGNLTLVTNVPPSTDLLPGAPYINLSEYSTETFDTTTSINEIDPVTNSYNTLKTTSTYVQPESSPTTEDMFRIPTTSLNSDNINTTKFYEDETVIHTHPDSSKINSTNKTLQKNEPTTPETYSLYDETKPTTIQTTFQQPMLSDNNHKENVTTDLRINTTEIMFPTLSNFISNNVTDSNVNIQNELAVNDNNSKHSNDYTINAMLTTNENTSSKIVSKIIGTQIADNATRNIETDIPLNVTKIMIASKSWTQHKFFPNSKGREKQLNADSFNHSELHNFNAHKMIPNSIKNDTFKKQTSSSKVFHKLKEEDKSLNNIMQGDESPNRNENQSSNISQTSINLVNKTSEKYTVNILIALNSTRNENTLKTQHTSNKTKHEYTNVVTNQSNSFPSNSSVRNSVPTNHSTKIPTNKSKLLKTNTTVTSEKVASKQDNATSSSMNSGNITYIINTISIKYLNRSEDGTELSPNTTTPLEGENLVFENVTLAMGDKSVFYSSRASDAFASGVRVSVKDSISSSLVSGSHPGMFVLLGVGLAMAGALAMALSHCAKRRRRLAVEYSRQQDIEVRSMSSIGDLW
ncbi:uncharacterized protein [Periplaneta americana]|uniref:uncharacterized protein n=1 Tax=Periplaneta americana TaxID=6978 RepID=UPI0037E75A14